MEGLDSISYQGSERAVLSICICNPEGIVECETNGLTPDYFVSKPNRYIYSTIAYIYSQGTERIDSVLLYNNMNETVKEVIDEIGGMTYLDALCETKLNIDGIGIYIEQLRNAYVRREMFKASHEIIDMSVKETPTSELLQVSQDKIINIVLNNESKISVKKVGEGLRDRLRERLKNPVKVFGYEMGWEAYDKITQGDVPGEVDICIAPSKTGKSIYLLNKAKKRCIFDKIPTLYLDVELSKEEQEERLLASISGVPFEELRNGQFSQDTDFGTGKQKMESISKALTLIEEAPFFHTAIPDCSPENIRAVCKKAKLLHNIGYVILDYISLPETDVLGKNGKVDEYQKLGFLTATLKNIARELNVPISTAGQTNRGGSASQEPSEADIGGSYKILQKADKLFFLRDKDEEQIMQDGFEYGNQVLWIKFQRSGSSGRNKINFLNQKNIMRITEVKQDFD